MTSGTYAVCLSLLFATSCSHGAVQLSPHPVTRWELRPSLKYDALCLLNVLSGDPFYLQYYQREYDHFHPLFTPQEQAAFTQLKKTLKDDGHGIVSATLTLYYSTVDDETLPEMIRTPHDPSVMRVALQSTPYWIPEAWANVEQALPALETALRALDRVGFAAYWEQTARPRIEQRIAELSPDLPKYDIVPAVERYVGFPRDARAGARDLRGLQTGARRAARAVRTLVRQCRPKRTVTGAGPEEDPQSLLLLAALTFGR